MQAAPKLFISYSWSTPEHEQWVINLATELRESGVDVVLDKWDLKEGHDAISFMEKMVTDPSIKKVAVISDKTYAEKADGRAGGVGTETQIISREVYEKQDQEKFVAVLPEKDENGKAYLPTYYKGRIYIDLSESERYADNFEQLMRWIFDKPIHVKPALGKVPAYLAENERTSLGTTPIQRRLLDALRNGKPHTQGTLDEYLRTFTNNLERFRLKLTGNQDDKTHNQVAASIEQFAPFRAEYIQTIQNLSQYAITKEATHKLHRFFERAAQYMYRNETMTSYHPYEFDSFKFIVHELFLYTNAVLIRDEHFTLVDQLLGTPYYFGEPGRGGITEAVRYYDLREYMRSFESRDKELGRLSSRADILKANAEQSGVEFRHIMQADFMLYLRAAIASDGYHGWWPETGVYATHYYNPFEVFARAVSTAYFDRMKAVLGIESTSDLRMLFDRVSQDHHMTPRWGSYGLDLKMLSGFDKLCARP
jgi:hypothetical protein